ncbi:four helix bundle protein [Algivirga pacifica]|uniref:Four helix bundle protein n=1 Tax=Algivirga pacifica TaxID=1162670 RepID=A0ABP9DJC7_9BACT
MGVALEKSYNFALNTVKSCYTIMQEHKEYIITKQLIRCATSVGANIEEAQGGQSVKDFTAKMYIAYKEAKEAHYWYRLLKDLNMISLKEAKEGLEAAEELQRIIGSICKTSKNIK